jgi:hypothetical protein
MLSRRSPRCLQRRHKYRPQTPVSWSKEVQEISENSFGTTYSDSSVALDLHNGTIPAVIDLHNGTIPTTGALECAVIDLHNGTIPSLDSSALKVACGPPGIEAKC